MRNVIFQGLLCIGVLKRARERKQISREQVAKDLEVKSKYQHLSSSIYNLLGEYWSLNQFQQIYLVFVTFGWHSSCRVCAEVSLF